MNNTQIIALVILSPVVAWGIYAIIASVRVINQRKQGCICGHHFVLGGFFAYRVVEHDCPFPHEPGPHYRVKDQLDEMCVCSHTRRQHTDPMVYPAEHCVHCPTCEDFVLRSKRFSEMSKVEQDKLRKAWGK